MREGARQILPWALLGLTVAVGAVGIWLDAVSDGPEAEWGSYVFPVAVAMSSGVGFVLARRRRENPIGWLLLANGLILACSGVPEEWATYALFEHPGTTPR